MNRELYTAPQGVETAASGQNASGLIDARGYRNVQTYHSESGTGTLGVDLEWYAADRTTLLATDANVSDGDVDTVKGVYLKVTFDETGGVNPITVDHLVVMGESI